MIKNFKNVKTALVELVPVINSFQSETVQVKLVDVLLNTVSIYGEADLDMGQLFSNQPKTKVKKMGASKILDQIIETDFFETPRSIREITAYCNEEYNTKFQTHELSGILLSLIKSQKLYRHKAFKIFVYSKNTF